MTNKKLTFEEMASSYRCCDNGDLNEKHDCLKQNTDIEEVVEELSETIVEQIYPKMVDFKKGFIGVTDVEDSIASLLKHALTTHAQSEVEKEREFILNILDGIDTADKQTGNINGGTEAIRLALKSRII